MLASDGDALGVFVGDADGEDEGIFEGDAEGGGVGEADGVGEGAGVGAGVVAHIPEVDSSHLPLALLQKHPPLVPQQSEVSVQSPPM